ncbi:MAG: hypothetical protein H7838_07250 [Magnetococcus sp. DMHC-8]
MKKAVVDKIIKNLQAKGWMIERIKKMDFWAFQEGSPAFCVVQAGDTLIFFCDLPLNDRWKKGKARFFEMLNGINNTLSHGVRVIKLNDEAVGMLHMSAVWHNYYDKNGFSRFLDQFVASVDSLSSHAEVIRHLQR